MTTLATPRPAGPPSGGQPWPGPLNPPPPYPTVQAVCGTCRVPRESWDHSHPLHGDRSAECPECTARAIAEDAAAVRAEDYA